MPEPITVMVVDDDSESRTQLMMVLETLGYSAEAAASGEEALARLADEENRPDAMLLDVLMPGIDGMEILKRYRSSGGRAPVLMISALDKAETVVQAMKLGATDY